MFRVTSLTEMSDAQLNRWLKRLGLVLVVGVLAFVAFYAIDRFRAPSTPMVDRQLAAAEEQVRQSPQDVNTRLRLAALYEADKRWTDAITQYDEVLKISAGNRIAVLGKGQSQYQLGDLAAAAATYQILVDDTKGQEFSPVDTQLQEAQYYLGAIALQQSDAKKAIDAFNAALAINRSDADSLYGLGAAYVLAKQPDKAIEPLRSAILFVPIGWAEPYTALADAYTGLNKPDDAAWASAMAVLAGGDYATAKTQLEALAAKAPSADVYVGLGLVAEKQGDPEAATAAYKKALEADPNSLAAGEGLGRANHSLNGSTPAPVATPGASPMASPAGNAG